MRTARTLSVLTVLLLVLGTVSAGASVDPGKGRGPTAEDVASAIPRDLVIDHRGLGYLRLPSGNLRPYGHDVAAERRPITPLAPGGVPGPPGGGGGGGGDVVSFSEWNLGGAVEKASGRVLFRMVDGWYVCSGTVATDGVSGRSIVITAAHCIYDDVDKSFALQAIFIPNQDDGGSDRTDLNCDNDPYGCWNLDHGVVDVEWTTRTFPDNIPWDYGYYVVADVGAHDGNGTTDGLEDAVGSLVPKFTPPTVGEVSHALGYSYDVDPELMYCKESLGTEGSANYWLSRCDMSGGSSGGPWVQPMDEGSGYGPIISVNSWGYTFQSGMAGPKLHDNSASSLFEFAQGTDLSTPDRGFVYGAASNTAPTVSISSPADGASFDSGTTITFAGSASDSEDGDLSGNLVWTFDVDGQIGTGASVSATLSDGTHTITASVTDSGNSTVSDSITVTVGEPSSGDFTLSVSGFKIKGTQHADLTWSGATSENVDVYRDGSVVATTANEGAYTDNLNRKGGGSVTYQVCEATNTDNPPCSNEVTVTW